MWNLLLHEVLRCLCARTLLARGVQLLASTHLPISLAHQPTHPTPILNLRQEPQPHDWQLQHHIPEPPPPHRKPKEAQPQPPVLQDISNILLPLHAAKRRSKRNHGHDIRRKLGHLITQTHRPLRSRVLTHFPRKQVDLVIEPLLPALLQPANSPRRIRQRLPQHAVLLAVERGEEMRRAQHARAVEVRLAVAGGRAVDVLQRRGAGEEEHRGRDADWFVGWED